MMRCVCVDLEGSSDIPMRLLIAAVLTSLVVPVFWGAYGDLSTTMTEGSLESELYRLVSAVQDAMSGGEGSRVEVRLDLKGWGACDIEEVVIGGGPEDWSANRFLVRYAVSGSPEKRIAPQPLTVMTTAEGTSLELSEGSYVISVTHFVIGTTRMAVLGIE